MLRKIKKRLNHCLYQTTEILKGNEGIGVVEVILILVDILIMEKRYIYCE